MNDPLSPFRKNPARNQSLPAGSTEAEEYAAFNAKDRATRLRVRCVYDPSHAPAYQCLLDVIYDDSKWTNFSLMFTFMTILVRGRNLQPVVMAIEAGAADFIQEFDEMKWKRPSDERPVIEVIKVIMQGDAVDAGEITKSDPH